MTSIRDVYIEGVRDAEKASGTAAGAGHLDEVPWLASHAVVVKVLRAIGQDDVADEIDAVTANRIAYMRGLPELEKLPW